MAEVLKNVLPQPKNWLDDSCNSYDHTGDPWFLRKYGAAEGRSSDKSRIMAKKSPVPPYLQRTGAGFLFKPSKPEDFSDGGAFPEVHSAQYPLDMGLDSKPGKILNFYDSIVGSSDAKTIVYSQYRDLVPWALLQDSDHDQNNNFADLDDEKQQKEVEETTQTTMAALEKIVNAKLNCCSAWKYSYTTFKSKFIKYKPSQQLSLSSGAKERIVTMRELPVDPLELPKLKAKKIPKLSSSQPVPVLRSPPRPLTVRDCQDWKMPPCISNWKNQKGYVIPLDKRLAADGTRLEDLHINPVHNQLYEALCVAEDKCREELIMKAKIQKEKKMKEEAMKEKQLLELAQKARSERSNVSKVEEIGEEKLQRDQIREERQRERKRDRILEAEDVGVGKRRKITRDRDRDISEQVALGMATTGRGRESEVMYDQRLFNQERGMDSGFGTDDSYDIYDKRLHTAQSTLSTLCRPKKDVDFDTYGGEDEQLEKIMRTMRFKPDRAFQGSSQRSGPRDSHVEFEKEAEESDPFSLDQFSTEVNKGKKSKDRRH